QPYIANLTSDTVDDIVIRISPNDLSQNEDKVYFIHYKGGQHLFDQGMIAMWDDSVYWGTYVGTNQDIIHRSFSQIDCRGTGRDDLITIDDWGNLFYYKNDLSFDIHKFVNSLRSDTLLSLYGWSLYNDFSGSMGASPIRAFPKPAWDRSYDIAITLPLSSDPHNNYGICLFEGGSNFGKKRLSLDRPDYFIHWPGYYSADFSQSTWYFEGSLGDLTGTGNTVMFTSGGAGIGYGYLALYVLGKAMDDQIDMFIPYHYGAGTVDTIVATSKGNPTLIWGSPAYESSDDQNNGVFEKGSLRVLYGAEHIPVHLNPQFSLVEKRSLDNSPHHLLAYPNPCDQSTVLTFDNCTGGKMIVDVISSSGEECLHEETPGGFGLQQYGLFLNDLAAGNYLVRLSCISDGWSTTTNIIKTGAAQAPWNLDLHKMMGK
ncbi:MAG: T9SS type A sorting domain-containing protein, partial [Candidatus Kapaibacterium sp.]